MEFSVAMRLFYVFMSIVSIVIADTTGEDYEDDDDDEDFDYDDYDGDLGRGSSKKTKVNILTTIHNIYLD